MVIIDENERKQLETIHFISSDVVDKSRSTFVAKATTVQSLQDVQSAYKALLLDPKSLAATHNAAAYILPNGDTGYADDGDHGMG